MLGLRSNTTSLEVNLEPGWLEVDPSSAPQFLPSPDPRLEKICDLQDVGKIHYPKGDLPIREFGEEKIAACTVRGIVDLDRELPPLPEKARKLCGLRPWVFWILVATTAAAVLAIIGGAVGGALLRRRANAADGVAIKTSPVLHNSKLAALQYVDKQNVTHERVYFQDKAGTLRESAWNSNTTGWTVTDISDPSVDVQLGTPLACACGYPHAMKNYTFVKSVYHAGTSAMLYERQAPINESGPPAWADHNFSGLYTAAEDSYLAAYWVQDFEHVNETLNVMWQQPNASAGLTIGQYTSDLNNSYPWVFTNLNHSVPSGSTFALSHYGVEDYLRVYTTSMDDSLQQSLYYAANYTLTGKEVTGFKLAPGVPITALTQDNTPLYPVWADRPQCSWYLPPTQLFLFGTGDRSTINAVTWNCSSGFVDITSSLQDVLQPKRSYLALSSHEGGKVYVMYDAGYGPEIEQWTVPPFSGQTWNKT